jgi:hypothetical protein
MAIDTTCCKIYGTINGKISHRVRRLARDSGFGSAHAGENSVIVNDNRVRKKTQLVRSDYPALRG